MDKKYVRILAIIVIAAIVGSVYWFTGDNTSDDQVEMMALKGETVEYMPGVEGYLALPEGNGPFPGMILIHEWWGLNDNIREFAEQFAQEGYAALAIDMYEGKATDDPAVARELASAVRGDLDGAFANLKAGVEYLKSNEKVNTEKLAAIGWCFGGQWSYEMAKNDLGVDASIMYYGRFNPDDDLAMMRANILGHFGEDDVSIAVDDVREFQAKLQTLSGEHEIFIYPNAGHAFANKDNEMSYVPEAAEVSWQRTLEFLSRQFGNEKNAVDADEILILDTDLSTLKWSAERIIGNSHTGNVGVTSGELYKKDGMYVGGDFVIDMTTITESNDNQRFLGHIASEDFFDVANYPEASIVLTSITVVEGNTYEIVADLTILGQTHEVRFSATLADAKGQVLVNSSFGIDRTKWGITYDSGTLFQQLGDKAIKDEIPFELNLVFNK